MRMSAIQVYLIKWTAESGQKVEIFVRSREDCTHAAASTYTRVEKVQEPVLTDWSLHHI